MIQQDMRLITSRIISLELEITSAIINGHKPSENDIFKDKRTEIDMLRCIFFGYESKFCKLKKGSHGTPFS
jgi:hypothetical protein